MHQKKPAKYPAVCRSPEERHRLLREMILSALDGDPIEGTSDAQCFSITHVLERMREEYDKLRFAKLLIKRRGKDCSWVYLLPEPLS